MQVTRPHEAQTVLFNSVKFKPNKAQEKVALLSLSVLLGELDAKACQPSIERAWQIVSEVDNNSTLVRLDELTIKNVNVEFYSLPECQNVVMMLQNVALESISVTRSAEGLNSVYLNFVVEVKVDTRNDLKLWLVDASCTQIWAIFENAQPELLQDAMNEMVDAQAEQQSLTNGAAATKTDKVKKARTSKKAKSGKDLAAGDDGAEVPEPPAAEAVTQ